MNDKGGESSGNPSGKKEEATAWQYRDDGGLKGGSWIEREHRASRNAPSEKKNGIRCCEGLAGRRLAYTEESQGLDLRRQTSNRRGV